MTSLCLTTENIAWWVVSSSLGDAPALGDSECLSTALWAICYGLLLFHLASRNLLVLFFLSHVPLMWSPSIQPLHIHWAFATLGHSIEPAKGRSSFHPHCGPLRWVWFFFFLIYLFLAAVHGVSKSLTRLSNWTELIFLAVLGLHCSLPAFSGFRERGLLFIVALRLLIVAASLVDHLWALDRACGLRQSQCVGR